MGDTSLVEDLRQCQAYIPRPASWAGRNQPWTREEDQIGMKVLKWTQYQDQAGMFKKSFVTQTNAHIDFDTCEKNG